MVNRQSKKIPVQSSITSFIKKSANVGGGVPGLRSSPRSAGKPLACVRPVQALLPSPPPLQVPPLTNAFKVSHSGPQEETIDLTQSPALTKKQFSAAEFHFKKFQSKENSPPAQANKPSRLSLASKRKVSKSPILSSQQSWADEIFGVCTPLPPNASSIKRTCTNRDVKSEESILNDLSLNKSPTHELKPKNLSNISSHVDEVDETNNPFFG